LTDLFKDVNVKKTNILKEMKCGVVVPDPYSNENKNPFVL